MRFTRPARLLLGIALLVGAVPVALFGIFVSRYYEGSGASYVKFGSAKVDGDLFGGIVLSIAAVAVFLAVVLLRGAFRARPS
jgi:hypothetical protein